MRAFRGLMGALLLVACGPATVIPSADFAVEPRLDFAVTSPPDMAKANPCAACNPPASCVKGKCCGGASAACIGSPDCCAGLTCTMGTCVDMTMACGGDGQPCCAGAMCNSESLTCQSGTCAAPQMMPTCKELRDTTCLSSLDCCGALLCHPSPTTQQCCVG